MQNSSINAYFRALQPDPLITVTQWANKYRVLPPGTARPGPFSTSVTPYVEEIMDHLSPQSPIQEIIVMKGSQVGFTEIGNNWLGAVICCFPDPFLYVMPTDTVMKNTSKTRIDPMINNIPMLLEKVRANKSRAKGNTIALKEFEGGFVAMVGANSPVGLSSIAVRNLYVDELDRCPLDVGGEGSVLKLGDTRTSTFGARKKKFITSTPTIKGASLIAKAFEATGQRHYHLPCPYCGGMQHLVFEQLRYEKPNYKAVTYECIHCKEQIPERYKTSMMALGKWIALAPEMEDDIKLGYHLSAMYSPYGMYSWEQMARDYEESENDIADRIVWVNTKQGLCYEGKGEKPNWQAIQARAAVYKIGVPFAEVVVITAGVDVQGDRLELEIVGWMPGMVSQQIDYRVLLGDTSQPEVWAELSQVVSESFRRADGCRLPIRLMVVDSGYNAKHVYSFTEKHSISRVIPIKGRAALEMAFTAPKTVNITKKGKAVGGVKVWGVGVNFLKAELYGRLKIELSEVDDTPPNGYCYFPKRDDAYFKGLTAEELTPKVSKTTGQRSYEWKKTVDRNEPLDCRVYNMAAAAVLGLDRWDAARWHRENMNYAPEPEPEVPTVAPAAPVAAKPAKRKSDFWK